MGVVGPAVPEAAAASRIAESLPAPGTSCLSASFCCSSAEPDEPRAATFIAAYKAPVGECAKQDRKPLSSVVPGPNVFGSVGVAMRPTSSQFDFGAVPSVVSEEAGSPQT